MPPKKHSADWAALGRAQLATLLQFGSMLGDDEEE